MDLGNSKESLKRMTKNRHGNSVLKEEMLGFVDIRES